MPEERKNRGTTDEETGRMGGERRGRDLGTEGSRPLDEEQRGREGMGSMGGARGEKRGGTRR